MSGVVVRIRPKKIVRRHRKIEHSARFEQIVKMSQKSQIVLDVFQNIKKANDRQAVWLESSCLRRGADHIMQATLFCIARTRRTWLDEHYVPPSFQKAFGHETISPAHVKNRPLPSRRKPLYQFNNARVAMLKPKRHVFNLETLVVAFARIRNRRGLVGIPDTVRISRYM